MAKLTFDKSSVVEDYQILYEQPIGTVIEIVDNYETVFQRVQGYLPDGEIFTLFPVTPGTKLFTIYGDSHAVVTENSMVI